MFYRREQPNRNPFVNLQNNTSHGSRSPSAGLTGAGVRPSTLRRLPFGPLEFLWGNSKRVVDGAKEIQFKGISSFARRTLLSPNHAHDVHVSSLESS
jgi:hypothetical protein